MLFLSLKDFVVHEFKDKFRVTFSIVTSKMLSASSEMKLNKVNNISFLLDMTCTLQ